MNPSNYMRGRSGPPIPIGMISLAGLLLFFLYRVYTEPPAWHSPGIQVKAIGGRSGVSRTGARYFRPVAFLAPLHFSSNADSNGGAYLKLVRYCDSLHSKNDSIYTHTILFDFDPSCSYGTFMQVLGVFEEHNRDSLDFLYDRILVYPKGSLYRAAHIYHAKRDFAFINSIDSLGFIPIRKRYDNGSLWGQYSFMFDDEYVPHIVPIILGISWVGLFVFSIVHARKPASAPKRQQLTAIRNDH